MSVKILPCLHAKNNDNNSNSNFPSLVDCLHVAYDQLRIITSSLIFRAVQQQQRLWWDHEPLIWDYTHHRMSESSSRLASAAASVTPCVAFAMMENKIRWWKCVLCRAVPCLRAEFLSSFRLQSGGERFLLLVVVAAVAHPSSSRLVSVLNPHYVDLSQPRARLFLGVSRSEMRTKSKSKDKRRNNETEGMHHEPTEPLLSCHCFTTPVAFSSSFFLDFVVGVLFSYWAAWPLDGSGGATISLCICCSECSFRETAFSRPLITTTTTATTQNDDDDPTLYSLTPLLSLLSLLLFILLLLFFCFFSLSFLLLSSSFRLL